jgi:dipeptidyl-peptidase-4
MKTFSFTDSDHSIVYNGASTWIYKFFMARLWDEVQRDGKTSKHQWSRRGEDVYMQ